MFFYITQSNTTLVKQATNTFHHTVTYLLLCYFQSLIEPSLCYSYQQRVTCKFLEFIHYSNMKIDLCSLCCSIEIPLYKEEKTYMS